MPNVKKVQVQDTVSGSYSERPIGADAQNVEVSFDANGEIITDITAPGAIIDSTEGLASVLKDLEDNKADKVSSVTSGNFAGLDVNGNLTDSGSKASDFLSSNYLETSTKTTASSKDTFTFTDSAITSTASFDVYSDVFGAPIVDMVLSGNQLSVSFNSSDNVETCRLYIK